MVIGLPPNSQHETRSQQSPNGGNRSDSQASTNRIQKRCKYAPIEPQIFDAVTIRRAGYQIGYEEAKEVKTDDSLAKLNAHSSNERELTFRRDVERRQKEADYMIGMTLAVVILFASGLVSLGYWLRSIK